MRYVRLVAVEDEYDNTPGLAIKGCRTDYEGFMAARDGNLIAHDLIEHQNGLENMGPVWDELQALGGIWHTRGRWGQMLTKYGSHFTPDYHIGASIQQMHGDHMLNGYHHFHDWDLLGPKLNTYEHLYDEDFLLCIEQARGLIEGERKSHCECPDDHEYYTAARDAILAASLHHLRTGFRKAERRFGGYDFKSHDTYRRIQDAVNGVVKMVDFEGQEFLLGYSSYEATISEVYEEEY